MKFNWHFVNCNGFSLHSACVALCLRPKLFTTNVTQWSSQWAPERIWVGGIIRNCVVFSFHLHFSPFPLPSLHPLFSLSQSFVCLFVIPFKLTQKINSTHRSFALLPISMEFHLCVDDILRNCSNRFQQLRSTKWSKQNGREKRREHRARTEQHWPEQSQRRIVAIDVDGRRHHQNISRQSSVAFFVLEISKFPFVSHSVAV